METHSVDASTDLTSLATRIVLAVYDYRFLTGVQVAELFSLAPAEADDALGRLVDAGFLAGIRRPVLSEKTPDTVYALAQRGANLVASQLGADRRSVRWRKYHNYVGLLYVEHRLAVNDFRIALTLGAQRLGHRVEVWRYEVPIREDVDDPDEHVPPLVFRPDAYARCAVGPRRVHLFLEMDMGTEGHKRFAKKIRRYLAYKDSGLFRHRFGGRSFRVLIVAPTATRMRALERVAEGEGARRVFWLLPAESCCADRLSSSTWRLAGGSETAVLLRPDGHGQDS
ncbi:MAG: replication-relaxation family protein [Bacillota bacterium]|nr:replication-relaxation family protein [Bacillota bacterium]